MNGIYGIDGGCEGTPIMRSMILIARFPVKWWQARHGSCCRSATQIITRCGPWIEIHGYRQTVAPRRRYAPWLSGWVVG